MFFQKKNKNKNYFKFFSLSKKEKTKRLINFLEQEFTELEWKKRKLLHYNEKGGPICTQISALKRQIQHERVERQSLKYKLEYISRQLGKDSVSINEPQTEMQIIAKIHTLQNQLLMNSLRNRSLKKKLSRIKDQYNPEKKHNSSEKKIKKNKKNQRKLREPKTPLKKRKQKEKGKGKRKAKKKKKEKEKEKEKDQKKEKEKRKEKEKEKEKEEGEEKEEKKEKGKEKRKGKRKAKEKNEQKEKEKEPKKEKEKEKETKKETKKEKEKKKKKTKKNFNKQIKLIFSETETETETETEIETEDPKHKKQKTKKNSKSKIGDLKKKSQNHSKIVFGNTYSRLYDEFISFESKAKRTKFDIENLTQFQTNFLKLKEKLQELKIQKRLRQSEKYSLVNEINRTKTLLNKKTTRSVSELFFDNFDTEQDYSTNSKTIVSFNKKLSCSYPFELDQKKNQKCESKTKENQNKKEYEQEKREKKRKECSKKQIRLILTETETETEMETETGTKTETGTDEKKIQKEKDDNPTTNKKKGLNRLGRLKLINSDTILDPSPIFPLKKRNKSVHEKLSTERDSGLTTNVNNQNQNQKHNDKHKHTHKHKHKKKKNKKKQKQLIGGTNTNSFSSIESLLRIPKAFEYFLEFLYDSMNLENLLFFQDVKMFKIKCRTEKQIKKIAKKLIRKYIKPNSMFQININHKIRESILKKYNNKNINLHIFDEAQSTILGLLKFGQWNLFKQSDLYYELVTKMINDPQMLSNFNPNQKSCTLTYHTSRFQALNEENPYKGQTLSANKVSFELITSVIDLLSANYSISKNKINFQNISNSIAFSKFVKKTSKLQKIKLQSLIKNDIKRKCFFLNIANVLIIHSLIIYGFPTDRVNGEKFFRKSSYLINDHYFSLYDIYHGILRANTSLKHYHKFFKSNDIRAQFALPNLDPRIHFALINNISSSSYLIYYNPKFLEKSLNKVTIKNLSKIVKKSQTKIFIPSIFRDFEKDFSSKKKIKILNWINNFFKKNDILLLQNNSKYSISYIQKKYGNHNILININRLLKIQFYK
ncbi:electron carrier/ protein disulfide oxidoreductase [Anaeramoeba flamelloides]|uniref:Electron carrier/ protein disulfide oxidoreductase n=1 Tax=Anaeramoeba flamelloides TaxID=1746091 RepID=A0AAV7ZMS3_9EUKA|nr:electron carrier/ protein disulfide oxidoreductase [Anaeramoeba flamelloides]